MASNIGFHIRVSSGTGIGIKVAGETTYLVASEVEGLGDGIVVTGGRMIGHGLVVGTDGNGFVIDGIGSVLVGSRIGAGLHAVHVTGEEAVVKGNHIFAAGVGDVDAYDGIHLEGNRNLAEGNFINGNGDTRSAVNASGDDNVYVGNVASGTYATAEYIDSGTGNQNTYPAGAGDQGDNFIIT